MAAVRNHFRIKCQTAVSVRFVAGGENFGMAFYANPFAGLKIQCDSGGAGSCGELPSAEWVRYAPAEALKHIVKPFQGTANPDSEIHETPAVDDQQKTLG